MIIVYIKNFNGSQPMMGGKEEQEETHMHGCYRECLARCSQKGKRKCVTMHMNEENLFCSFSCLLHELKNRGGGG